MEKELTAIWEVSLWEFVFVTIFLAGGAAYMTGRSVAKAWQSQLRLVFFVFLLTCATRFIHFALFNGTLLSLHYFIVDFVVLLGIAFLGKHLTRKWQMARQYGFMATAQETANPNAERAG